MPNPQKENGFTPVAHEIIEAVARTSLNGTQIRILLIIWRFTYGFNRKTHSLSETFIANATGIHRKQVQRELNDLIKKRIITVETEATFTTSRVLKFNKHYNSWVVTDSLPGNEKDTHTGSELAPSPGSGLATQERNIKENYKEREEAEPSDRTPYQNIIKLYHEICPSYPKLRTVSESRKKHIKARYGQYSSDISIFEELFAKAQSSDFLKGQNDRGWQATFDWMMAEDNFTKILEGRYDNKPDPDNGHSRFQDSCPDFL